MKKWFWKRRLRSRYRTYVAILDQFSCGASLAEAISSRVYNAKLKVNEAIRKCRELDPTCKLEEIS
jgi:hypothetical protein